MDDARINLIKDALLKSLVYEISAIKNVEYDTNQVAKVGGTIYYLHSLIL